MALRVILDPQAFARMRKNCSNTQQAPQSRSHGGKQLSGAVKSPRRSFRHFSSRTASGSRESKNYSTRMVRRQSLAPLSHGTSRLPTVSHSRKTGSSTSNTSRSTAHTAGSQASSLFVNKQLYHRYPLHTKVSLSEARQVVDLHTDWLGRKPSIMDVILDSRSPSVDFDEDALLEAIRRNQEPTCLRYQYSFEDELSLATYWADEAVRWRMRTLAEGINIRFPDSDERSTASWSPSLDEQQLAKAPCFVHVDDTQLQ